MKPEQLSVNICRDQPVGVTGKAGNDFDTAMPEHHRKSIGYGAAQYGADL